MTTGRRSLIRAALDIVADQWTILILREFFIGASQWSDFTNALNIPPATLNARLKQLVRSGCVVKRALPPNGAPGYELTDKGSQLFPIQMAMREWQLKWDARPGAWVTPWVHACGQPLRCHSACHACGKDLRASEISLVDRPVTFVQASGSEHNRRLYSVAGVDRRSSNPQPGRVIEVSGDRCATLIMAALLRGCKRFDEIERWTELPPATLSQRLRKLQILGLVHTRLYQERPDRSEYYPSPAGWDLLELTLALYQWAERCLAKLKFRAVP